MVFPTGAFPYGIDARDALGNGNDPGVADGYPDVVISIGQVSVWSSRQPYGYTGLLSELRVYRNVADWSATNPVGLSHFRTIFMPIMSGSENRAIFGEVKWAYMNPDDHMDLVAVASHHYDDSFAAGDWGVYVFRWDDLSNEYVLHDFSSSDRPLRDLALGDFNNDGFTDVAAAVDIIENPYQVELDTISIFYNLGNGALGPENAWPATQGPGTDEPSSAVVTGYFNAFPGASLFDDAFTGARGNTTNVAHLLSSTGSSFNSTTLTVNGCAGTYTDLVASPWTAGKVRDDIAAYTTDNTIQIFHSTGSGGFSIDCYSPDPPDVYLHGEPGPRSDDPLGLAVGHLNGGTKPDLIAGTSSSGGGASVHMLLGKGDGRFQHVANHASYDIVVDDGSGLVDGPLRVATADMNQDGFDDVLSANHGTYAGDGTFSVVINATTIVP